MFYINVPKKRQESYQYIQFISITRENEFSLVLSIINVSIYTIYWLPALTNQLPYELWHLVRSFLRSRWFSTVFFIVLFSLCQSLVTHGSL